MTTNRRTLFIAPLMATVAALFLFAGPAAAMSLTSSLSFPSENGTWGCSFYGNCKQVITKDRKAK